MKKAIFLIALSLQCGSVLAKADLDVGCEVIGGWRWDSREIYPNNEFYLRRIRPKIDVDFDSLGRFSAKVSADLNSDFAELKDAKVEFKLDRRLELGFGRKRKPFGIEDLFGLRNIPSANWTEIHEISESAGYLDRDVGVWGAGKLFQEPYQIEYELGLYNGAGGSALTSEKQFAGRLILSPLRFLDLVCGFGMGLDTLGLERRSAWNAGFVFDPAGFEVAGEMVAGEYLENGRGFEGFQVWARYYRGRFAPYIQFEMTETQPAKAAETVAERRGHLGFSFDPNEYIRLKLQASYIDDDGESPRGDFSAQVYARY